MDQKNGDNVNHSAHFTGSVFGIVFVLVLEPGVFPYFIDQIMAKYL